MSKSRTISDADWAQLLTVASGYLSLCEGDLERAMQRALSAHAGLIATLKADGISADTPEGRVVLHVPDSGGIAIRRD